MPFIAVEDPFIISFNLLNFGCRYYCPQLTPSETRLGSIVGGRESEAGWCQFTTKLVITRTRTVQEPYAYDSWSRRVGSASTDKRVQPTQNR